MQIHPLLLAFTGLALSGAKSHALAAATVTKTVVSTRTIYTAAPSASCTNPAELTGFRTSFGWDPLTINGSGIGFLNAYTPSNDPANANTGTGYAIGNFKKSKSNLDVFTASITNVTVVPNTQYTMEIYAKHNGTNFCQLYLSANGVNTGGSVGQSIDERCDVYGTYSSCSAIFSSSDYTSVDLAWTLQCFPNGGPRVAYSVFFDDAAFYDSS